MSSQETLDKITPHAFSVASGLLNIPLARPWRRGVAMLIDLALIAWMATMPLWALMLSLVLVGGLGIIQARKHARGVKRWLPLLLLPVLLVMVLVAISDLSKEGVGVTAKLKEQDPTLAHGLGVLSAMPVLLKTGDCKTLECWQPHLPAIGEYLALPLEDLNSVTSEEKLRRIDELMKDSELQQADRDTLATLLKQRFVAQNEIASQKTPEVIEAVPTDETSMDKTGTDQISGDKTNVDESAASSTQPASSSDGHYQPLRWVKGFFDELGLGFGWAAFYFTALTAWGNGQTLGKRLTGIQVVQLDNSQLSLWDAFGRYGGYGAGLATGLMGFMQIYWDPNRQAIQDKVSATVVIDRRRWQSQKNKLTDSETAES